MRVLFDFSRQSVQNNYQIIYGIRRKILSSGALLTNDLLKEYSKKMDGFSPQKIFNKISDAIRKSDCVIIEGSNVSFSLGYILTESINLGKPTLFLSKFSPDDFRNRFLSSIKSPLLIIYQYSKIEDVNSTVSDFLKTNPNIKTRFNLVLPNRLNSYIASKSKEKNCSKTEYILDLIEKDMKNIG